MNLPAHAYDKAPAVLSIDGSSARLFFRIKYPGVSPLVGRCGHVLYKYGTEHKRIYVALSAANFFRALLFCVINGVV